MLEIIFKNYYFVSVQHREGLTAGFHHLAVTRLEKTPASTILLISASPMFNDTHSLSWLALVVAFFGFLAPLFGAISQIWFGIGGGSSCEYESRSARVEEEDKGVK